MSKVKITEGSWKDQVGEFVSEIRGEVVEGEEVVEKVVAVVARMAGNRLVEFAPERVEHVADEPEADEADSK